MEITTLGVENWKEYRDLRLRALKEDPEAFSSAYAASQELPDENWQRRLADAVQGAKNWLLFARENNRLVGMIGAFVADNTPDMVTIVSVYVPKEERGKGISARLMGEMLKVLSHAPSLKKAQLAVNANQAAAVGLYRRFGFRVIGRQAATTGAGERVLQLVMERRLPV